VKDSDIQLLQSLVPGLGEVPMSSAYWIQRAEKSMAVSTRGGDVYPVVDHTRGHGVWLYDIEGNEYLDVTSGVAVRALGLRPKGMRDFEEKIVDVVEELPGQDFDNIPQTLLAERLNGITPGDFPKQTFFTTSGARAIETAIKAAMDQTGRRRFVAFRPAFHGRTGYALALTASKAIHREGYPQALDVIRTPYANPYRTPGGSTPEDAAAYALLTLRDAIENEGGDIAAIVVESVAGEGGMIVPPPEFLQGLRAIADEHGALLVADEVQSGLGRTGTWWAIEHAGVVPDMVTSAKALGGGYPLGATIGRSPMFREASRHSETFSAEPRLALLSLFVLKSIEEQGLMDNARIVGGRMLEALRDRLTDNPHVGDIRGLGFMMGIEFVEDRASKTPDPALRDRIIQNAVSKQHLWILGAGQSAIRLLPSLNTTEEEAMEAVTRFVRAIDEEAGRAGRSPSAAAG